MQFSATLSFLLMIKYFITNIYIVMKDIPPVNELENVNRHLLR